MSEFNREASSTITVPPLIGVGIGGRVREKLQAFLKIVPAECGYSLIIAQSDGLVRDVRRMPIALSESNMSIVEVSKRILPRENHVYVPSLGKGIAYEDKHLIPVDLPHRRSSHSGINVLFRSLADGLHSQALCILLDARTEDGIVGLRTVKERGGCAIAELSPATALDDSGSVPAGLVDFFLPLQDIPAKIAEQLSFMKKLQHAGALPEEPVDFEKFHCEMASLILARTGHDFSQYKQSTIQRRVQRRMQVRQLVSLRDYLEALRKEEQEAERLFQDLLVGVTNFFRDPEAFESFSRLIVPALCDEKGQGESVRAWVLGCATGEEAYSVAILFQEYLEKMEHPPGIQIFATDIDDQALETARQGRYGEDITEDVSAERLEKYFVRVNGGYQICKEIRGMCVFAEHNLIADPPFGRLDLLTCRNLLIYLNSNLQRKLVPLFHYALRPRGYLFLGPAENVLQDTDKFEKIDKNNRIFRSLDSSGRGALNFPLAGGHRRRVTEPLSSGPEERTFNVADQLERFLREKYTPPAVVVNQHHEIIYFSGNTSPYLSQPEGAPSLNILQMAHKDLRLELHAALHHVRQERHSTVRRRVELRGASPAMRMELIVQEMSPEAAEVSNFIVVFSPTEAVNEDPKRDTSPLSAQESSGLDQELRAAREHLDATIRELEVSNEKLKLNNEELLSMNEELQSSNEELQMSQEELQSLNEELETLNTEMRKKVEELDAANSDLQNLFESTDIATIFVDTNLRIKKFTPATRALFRLIETDHGRPVTDIVTRFNALNLEEEIESVLRTLNTVEREVSRSDGSGWYMMRILPYRTVENVIDGVVITFSDVSGIKHAEQEITRLNENLQWRVVELETILEILPIGVAISEDAECRRVILNDAARILTGLAPIETSLSPAEEHVLPYQVLRDGKVVLRADLPLQRAAALGVSTRSEEMVLQPASGEPVEILVSASPLRYESGELRGAVAAFSDVSALNRAMRKAELRAAQQNAVASLGVMALERASLKDIYETAANTVHDLLSIEFTKILELLPGREEFLLRSGTGWKPGIVGTTRLTNDNRTHAGFTLGATQPVVVNDFSKETRFHWPALLERNHVRSGISVIIGEFDNPIGVFGAHSTRPRIFTSDEVSFVQAVANVLASATHRQRQEDALALSEERYRSLIAAMTSIVWVRDAGGAFAEPQPSWEEYTGQSWEEHRGFGWLEAIHPEDRERVKSSWMQAVGNTDLFVVEGRIYHAASESFHYYRARAVPLRNPDGTVREWIGVVADEDARRRAELAIIEREERYRAVGESFNYGVWMADRRGRCLFLSESFADLLGVSVAYLKEHGWDEFLPPEDVETMREAWRDALETGSTWEFENRLRCADGAWRTVLSRGRPVRNQEGDITAWAGVNFDITERKRMEEERERLAKIVETSYDGIFTKTLEGIITSWNFGAEQIYGYTATEVVGKSVHMLAPAERHEELDSFMARLRAGEPLRDFETERMRKDGRRIFVSLRISPLHDDRGRATSVSVIARDITERVQARDSLQRMNEMLEQRVQERTANLIKYQGRLRALLEELMVTEQRERRRLSIEMHDYLAQLLVACRMKLEQMRHSPPSSVDTLIGEADSVLKECITYTRTLIAELSPNVLYEAGIVPALQWLGRQMKEHALEVEVRSHGEMVRLREDFEILVYQAARELLINVAKHSGQPRAFVDIYWDARQLTVKVSDRGAGFDVNEQRILSETRKKFGLFNVAERIEASEGEFEISSHPGAGTEASFMLPAVPREAVASGDAPVQEKKKAIRVLVADDHELVRRGLRRIIDSSPDFEVVYEAANGEDAWEWTLRLNPDIVLMDFNMPRMNGIESTKRIKSDLPEVQVVGLSLHDDPQLSAAMLAAGAHAYLSKGGPPEELFQALHAAYQSRIGQAG